MANCREQLKEIIETAKKNGDATSCICFDENCYEEHTQEEIDQLLAIRKERNINTDYWQVKRCEGFE